MRGPRQSILKTLEQSSSSIENRGQSILIENYTFNQDVTRIELAKIVVLHEYPLSIVDHIGFRRFCHALQPLFKVITSNTLKADIMKVYDAERSKVMKSLDKTTSHVAITTDMWTTTNQNKGYMSVITHFIDND
ncbi:zinc finger BED domain-containing protein DAYSLEEPER-like [Abrus precatorius]|uniref:Zinc finger BED domain-containing protein DAYSLEEPER-like n=1 Tax=Abrus precatorius TaxID=3816 RepID=A0A8B8M9D5_ABRPR|nr:zinc finger BED domain-containing protein DAYSLEEPER-like [Abrus precatorius]